MSVNVVNVQLWTTQLFYPEAISTDYFVLPSIPSNITAVLVTFATKLVGCPKPRKIL